LNIRQILRKPFVSTVFAEPIDLANKHIIVTGSSLGSLGYETAKALARWGAVVVVTSRSDTLSIVQAIRKDLAREGVNPKLDGHALDLSDVASVKAFGNWYQKHYGERLDVLVNNAGVHLDMMSKWKQAHLSADGYEIQWRINYLGTEQLTHSLMPLLQKTGREFGGSRVVNVVSQLHSKGSNSSLFDDNRGYNSWRAYGSSKLALIHYSHDLQRRFSSSDQLTSYCLHPGGASGSYTNVADKGFEGSPIIGFFRKLGAPLERLLMATAEEGAQTQIHCATAATAQGGYYYVNCQIAEATADTQDETTARRLWQETNEWLNQLSA
jgi:retinol dehydrogenase-12